MDRVIVGGTVVTSAGSSRADVAIADGRITSVGLGLPTGDAEVIDATGLLILPGTIDVHTHMRLSDDRHPSRFGQDLAAAAAGGTTTVLTFNNPGTGISEHGSSSPLTGLDEFRSRTQGEAPIDYGLCSVISGQQPDALAQLPELIARGVPTFKAFMVYDFALPDPMIERAMRIASEHGGMLQLHCEEPSIIGPLISDAIASGRVGPRFHAACRPPRAEAVATRRAIEMARRAEAPLYIVHLSCEEALEAVADAKASGECVFAETCPHYLTMTDALYADDDDAEVIKRVISPPLRSARDVESLWAGLRDGILDVVGSDHVPDRLDTEKRLPAPPFPEISNGGPGIETLTSVIYSEGVVAGRLTLERMVEVLSATPAQLFGLDRKGGIEVGLDADLALWDAGATRTLRQADLRHTSDFTPYEGLQMRGAPVRILTRGRDVGPASGRFLERRLRQA
ncbi:MAG: amidohydrolase family protein [Candidatus Limnocylindria bacterium]